MPIQWWQSIQGRGLISRWRYVDECLEPGCEGNIKELTTGEALDTLSGLNPVRFAYKADMTERHVGFIAEDVA